MSFVLESVSKPARTNQFHSELEYLWGKLAEDVSKHRSSKVSVILFLETLCKPQDLLMQAFLTIFTRGPTDKQDLQRFLCTIAIKKDNRRWFCMFRFSLNVNNCFTGLS